MLQENVSDVSVWTKLHASAFHAVSYKCSPTQQTSTIINKHCLALAVEKMSVQFMIPDKLHSK